MNPSLRYAITTVIALLAIYSSWMAFGYSVTQITCSTERVKEDNLSNLRFEVEDTSCDVLAKDEAIRIYVKDTTLDGRWFFSKWRNKRTLLFTYDPGRPDVPPPSISRRSQSTILISIPDVSQVIYET